LHDAIQLQSDEEMKTIISDNLKKVNEQSRDFIKDIIILINREIGINKILSILLFGSQISKHKESSKISDCDLLLIFKDRVSNRHIKEMERYFTALEIKHNFRENKSNLINRILRMVQQSTGMYISHFLTKRKYWIQTTFHKIFRVNKVFSSLIAPRNIVLGNVILNSAILYGEDLRNTIKSKIHITFFEMIRSTIMNLMLSVFSMGLALFKNINPIKYQLEAIKWSLRASNYYCYRDSESLKAITNRFISFEKPKFQKRAKRFYNEFLVLRKNPKKTLSFMVRCPIRILKIHIKAMFYKKAIKRKESLKVSKKFIEPIISEHTFPLKF
jgi:predicted nucleotidyltransferase